ncbi:DUF4279 domain-containing protein [Actinoplanes sp. NPDC023936]|uniref:DUF4279 domain-containing protein n=1 Tax=Actinoplanes sp. NPDC023936 TaxID=3154910 RepID=UPI0033D7762E
MQQNAGVKKRSRLTFVIQSEVLAADEISERMNLQPTNVLENGASASRRNPDAARRRHTTWNLVSDLPDDAAPAAHLEGLLPLLEPRRSVLRQIQETGAAAFWSCFVTATPTGNMLRFEPDLLSRLSQVGGALEFDIYDSDDD